MFVNGEYNIHSYITRLGDLTTSDLLNIVTGDQGSAGKLVLNWRQL